ncbi:iron reductase domain protein [Lophiostoma macrostomum CBS 122681]|uniref:Iron reductase domain protein n=1 Tax=Lophiostoma macrostomum CBS 122681 TaxID=1314788 RepID=A0A6A6T1J7_9PLEO|nr:iron reductase domain protein [Lophiostoma macrostomum CBS 122681]
MLRRLGDLSLIMRAVGSLRIASVIHLATMVVAAANISWLGSSVDVSYGINIPSTNDLSYSRGTIYLRIQTSSSYSWIALCIGDSMVNSTMFIIYADGKGNVTLSTRTAFDYNMPKYKAPYDSEVQATLLEGSEEVGGNITANIRCGNCPIITTSWCYAARSGEPMDNADKDASIDQHDTDDLFLWNVTRAYGGPDSNPFLDSTSSVTTSSTVTSPFTTNVFSTSTPTSTPAAHARKAISGGAIAGIVIAGLAMLVLCVGTCFFLKKRRKQRAGQPAEENTDVWNKPELHGTPKSLVELMGERDATELPIEHEPIGPVELAGDVEYTPAQASGRPYDRS